MSLLCERGGYGNRQLGRARQAAALTEVAHRHIEGPHYYQRCLDCRKTKREAIRALRRRISD